MSTLSREGESPSETIDRLIAEENSKKAAASTTTEPKKEEDNTSGSTPFDDEGEQITVPSEEEEHESGSEEGYEEEEEEHTPKTHKEPDYKAFYEKVTAPVRARGKTYHFTDQEDIRSLMSQGVDYSYKTNQLSKDRAAVSLIRNAGINDDDLRGLIDVFKGSPEAFTHFANKAGVDLTDVIDIDEGEKQPYKPKTEAVTPEQQSFADALTTVQSDTEVGGIVWNFLDNLPEGDIQKLFKAPNDIYILLDHARNGIFQAVLGRMEQLLITKKLDVTRGYLAAYNAVLQMLTNEGVFQPKNQTPKKPVEMTPPQPNLPHAERRKQVGPTRTVSSQRRNKPKRGLTMAEIQKIKDPKEFQEALEKFLADNQ